MVIFLGLLVLQGQTKEAQRGEEKNSKSQLCKIYLLFVRIILQLCRYWYIHYVTCPIKQFQYLALRHNVGQMSPNVDNDRIDISLVQMRPGVDAFSPSIDISLVSTAQPIENNQQPTESV